MRITYVESPDSVGSRRGLFLGRSAARQLAAIGKELRMIRGIVASAVKKLTGGQAVPSRPAESQDGTPAGESPREA